MTRQQVEGHQEGSRWINEPPSPDEFAKWFRENVKIHDGLDHADYLPGITLIPNEEKVKRMVIAANGSPELVKVEQLVFTPYPKVETRIKYFWDWCHVNGFVGELELLAPRAQNKNLPDGFFQIPSPEGMSSSPLIGMKHQACAYLPGSREPVMRPAAATKTVPLLKKGYNGGFYVNENAFHIAETGSQGRALGFAGMLIVPGAGIATAEDMTEFLAGDTAVTNLPPVIEPAAAATSLGDEIASHIKRLKSDFPDRFEEARAWAREKGFDLEGEIPVDAERALERALRKKVEQA